MNRSSGCEVASGSNPRIDIRSSPACERADVNLRRERALLRPPIERARADAQHLTQIAGAEQEPVVKSAVVV